MQLLNYDTIIFDLDDTLWDGSEECVWSKSLIKPWKKENDKIIDSSGKFIRLQNNVKTILRVLHKHNKNIGFITVGGLLNTEYDDQPPIQALKKFDIYKFFNFTKKVGYRTDNKSDFFEVKGNTVFIDDNVKNLIDVKTKFPNVTVLNRLIDFENWKQLL